MSLIRNSKSQQVNGKLSTIPASPADEANNAIQPGNYKAYNGSAKQGFKGSKPKAKKTPTPLSPADELITILKDGAKDKIAEALRSGKYDKCASDVGRFRVSPIHYACKNTIKFGVLKHLLDVKGTNPNVRDFSGETPLHYAVRSGSSQKVWLLLQNGADPMATNKDGNTSIHVACAQEDLKVLRLLLDKVDNVNMKNKFDYAPIHIAAENKIAKQDNKMLQMLVKKKAKLNDKNSFGKTPILRSSEMGNIVGAAFFIEQKKVRNFENVIEKARWNGMKRFLTFRVKKKCEKLVKQFLKKSTKGLNEQVKIDLKMEVRPCLLEEEEW